MAVRDPLEPADAMLTASAVAAVLCVHVNTVKHIPPRELPYVRVTSRGDRRYRASDLAAYIADRTVAR